MATRLSSPILSVEEGSCLSPDPFDKRPTPAEQAELLLSSIELTCEIEAEILRDCFRGRALRAVERDGPVAMADKARGRYESRFRELVDEHLGSVFEFPENSGSIIESRVVSEFSFRHGNSATPEVLGLIELTAPGNRSVVLTETKLFTLDAGVALVEGRSFDDGNSFEVRPLFSPRAYASELENLRGLAEETRKDRHVLERLEDRSLLYYLIRKELADRHGVAASWYREVGYLAPIGFPDHPAFEMLLTPNGKYSARPLYEPSSCRVSIQTRSTTQH